MQVFRSIGYRGVSVDKSIPFDSNKGIIPNTNGRVLDSKRDKSPVELFN